MKKVQIKNKIFGIKLNFLENPITNEGEDIIKIFLCDV